MKSVVILFIIALVAILVFWSFPNSEEEFLILHESTILPEPKEIIDSFGNASISKSVLSDVSSITYNIEPEFKLNKTEVDPFLSTEQDALLEKVELLGNNIGDQEIKQDLIKALSEADEYRKQILKRMKQEGNN